MENLINEKIQTLKRNIQDFLDLFRPLNLPETGGHKILVFNWRDIKHDWAGGAEVYIEELTKRWCEKGQTVVLFCGNDGKNKRYEIRNGVIVIRRGGFYTVYLWAALYYLIRLRGKFDVIVDSENGIPFFTPLFTAKPVILLIHHVHQEIFIEFMKFPLSYIGKFLEGKLVPLVYRNKQVVTVSESSKKEIIKAGIAKEEKITIVNPGITNPESYFKKSKIPTLIYLGRLKAYKNVDTAVLAFKMVLKKIKNARFWIVGEGDSSDYLKELVEKLKLNDSVKFFGKVSEKNKIKMLTKSWIAVQPSSTEGWGITVLEANACKTPVIASNTNGLIDSVLDKKTGILTKIKDKKSIYSAALKILRNDILRNQLSENAYRWSQQFGWDNTESKFSEVIRQNTAVKKRELAIGKIGLIISRLSSIF